jgi:formiminotetrahydrofolate cyclodeaminase
MYKQELKKYLDDLAAKIPAPGGGSAAALTAALGVALVSMVINFTLGKPKYAKYEKLLNGYLEKSEKLRLEFLDLVDLDVLAFRSKNIRKALDVPLTVCRLCFESLRLCPALITRTNVNLISDVAVAAVLLESAFTSANFNVEINLKYLDDPKFTKKLRKELKAKNKTIRKIRADTEVQVGKIIRG